MVYASRQKHHCSITYSKLKPRCVVHLLSPPLVSFEAMHSPQQCILGRSTRLSLSNNYEVFRNFRANLPPIRGVCRVTFHYFHCVTVHGQVLRPVSAWHEESGFRFQVEINNLSMFAHVYFSFNLHLKLKCHFFPMIKYCWPDLMYRNNYK